MRGETDGSLRDDLAPASVRTASGIQQRACKFRRGGLAVVVTTTGDGYCILHEPAGYMVAGTAWRDGVVVLAICLMLLNLGVDWTEADQSRLEADILAKPPTQEVLAALATGRFQPVEVPAPLRPPVAQA